MSNSHLHAHDTKSHLPTPIRLTLLFILLVAFALRSYTLDSQSFWSDEGISLQRAALPLDEMLAAMPVEHMPGYFVALHGWMALAGDKDFGLRFLSLWPSVLSIALIFRFAADLAVPAPTRWVVGVVAAGLMATGWFQVWYAQEARMYSWLLAAGLASSWALWRLLYDDRRRLAFAGVYALMIACSVYLHFYGFLTPIAHAIFMIGWLLVTRRWRVGLYWLGAGATAFLLFLPWLPRSQGIFGFGGWRAEGNPQEIPWRFLAAYTTGAAPPTLANWLPWLYLALFALGGVWWLRRRASAGFFLLANTFIPLGIVYGLALRNPDFHERYSIAITAGLLVLVAGGVVALDVRNWSAAPSPSANSRGALQGLPSVMILILLLGANVAALNRQTTDISLHKPDFRSAAQRIQQMQQPNDVILVDGPNPELVFNHYYTGGLPVHDLRVLEGADGAAIDQTLRTATADAQRAWEVLLFHAPAGVQVWLATHAYASEPTDHNGIRVTLYGLATPTEFVQEPNIHFGPALTLVRSAVNQTQLAAGDLLQVATDWQVSEAAPEYKFSLRLSDATGALVQSQDYVPQNWFAPTNVWVVGQSARDQHALQLPSDLAAGRYRLTLRLYDPTTGAAVETEAGQDVLLAEVELL